MNQIPSTDATQGVPLHPGVDFLRVRFAGDSGDGIQTMGAFFTDSVADYGNNFATFPDFPAEIRAPAGSLAGVSAFSINLGHTMIFTHGDQPDVLVALNAAALAAHLKDVREQGVLMIDSAGFSERAWKRAGYESDPRQDGSLDSYQVVEADISAQTLAAVEPWNLGRKKALLSRNMWALGLTLWLFGRDLDSACEDIRSRFSRNPDAVDPNLAALRAGHAYGETHEFPPAVAPYDIAPATVRPGEYRSVSGTQALSLGLAAAARLSSLPLYFASYPITPASPILHQLAGMESKDDLITTFQAEDEIGAVCAAIGASFGGALAATASSGPGIALMSEAVGFAVAAELPLLLIDMQRAGPSTGMPTKAEQSDLFLALYGRSGDAPIPVIAASSPSDCFIAAIEAARIAVRYMTPAMLLADGYIGNAAEPWRVPEARDLKSLAFEPRRGKDPAAMFARDSVSFARDWHLPGTPGFEHRLGGLERDETTGRVSYDPDNHHRMTEIRVAKTVAVGLDLPPTVPILGESTGQLAVLGWGSTYGAIQVAVLRARAAGHRVSHIHLRYLNPLPANLGDLLDGFDQVLLPENNAGQLQAVLAARLVRKITPLNKVAGSPFLAREIGDAINGMLDS